eukprot:g8297.t1
MLRRRARAGEASTYFNCNHLACLRSKYLRDNPLGEKDMEGLYKIHQIERDKGLTHSQQKALARRHLDYLWYSRKGGMSTAGDAGVVVPYVAGYDHVQPFMPRRFYDLEETEEGIPASDVGGGGVGGGVGVDEEGAAQPGGDHFSRMEGPPPVATDVATLRESLQAM